MVDLSVENGSQPEEAEQRQEVSKEVYVISQEIRIAKNLSCCNLKLREKQLRKLKKWLGVRAASSFEYSEDDLLRIWKGLFYCFWMSDKPLVQEELADEFGKLIVCFKDLKTSLRFFNAFLKTMCAEWFGLDQWRLDKFLMLIRRMLRYTFRAIGRENWPEEAVQDFNFYFAESVLDNDVTGMIMHLVEIFMDELAKTSEGNIPGAIVSEFTKPFMIYIAKQRDARTLDDVRDKIFYHLLWQTEMGREHQEKFEAWKEMGFPDINLDDLQKAEESSDDETEKESNSEVEENGVLDPRAGNVDVFIPVLPVDTNLIITTLNKILEIDIPNVKSKRCINAILDKYNKFEKGKFPLGVQKMPRHNLEPLAPLLERTVDNLEKLDDELHSVDRNLKKMNKKKRRKLLENLNLENVEEDDYENILKEAINSYNPHVKESAVENTKSKTSPKKRKMSMDWKEEEIETPKKNKKEKREKVSLNKENKTDNESIPKKNKKVAKLTNGKSSDENVEITTPSPAKENKDKKKKEKKKASKPSESEWDKPLEDGEIEFFVSSTKGRLDEVNKKFKQEKNKLDEGERTILINPYSKLNGSGEKKAKSTILGKKIKKEKYSLNMSLPEKKKVKIALGKNMVQKPSEYLKQIRNSPQVPYDAGKKPTKSLLKPNLMPSPINPFYKKKIGLQLNDTF